MITGSKELIRDINSHLILEAVVNHGPISRADLSKRLGLTKATVSAIVQILLDNYLLLEIGSGETKKGRKPILLDFHQKAGHVVSVDFGVDTATIFTSDLRGTGCRTKQYPTPKEKEKLLPFLKLTLSSAIQELPETAYGVVGITIGIHGVTHDNQVIFTPYYDLSGLDPARELSDTFHVPVFLENEANLSVLGERAFAFQLPNLVNISIHSGIGMGILMNGKLYTGNNGFAGEFGHTIVVPDGRPCPCGNLGCIEQYASERALLQDLARKKQTDHISMDAFFHLYLQKDPDALSLVDDFVKYMGIGINNVLNTFNPNLIIINSAFTMMIPGLADMLLDAVKNRMKPYCRILPSSLQDMAILLGGACISIKHFLGIDEFFIASDR